MAYNAKTDWKYDDNITENDVNRWEQGIADAHDFETATLYRKNKDENGIYALLEWYRADGTLFKTSELEGESPQYATRRVKFYAKDGQTLVQEVVYSLTYDENGELISEVIQA